MGVVCVLEAYQKLAMLRVYIIATHSTLLLFMYVKLIDSTVIYLYAIYMHM